MVNSTPCIKSSDYPELAAYWSSLGDSDLRIQLEMAMEWIESLDSADQFHAYGTLCLAIDETSKLRRRPVELPCEMSDLLIQRAACPYFDTNRLGMMTSDGVAGGVYRFASGEYIGTLARSSSTFLNRAVKQAELRKTRTSLPGATECLVRSIESDFRLGRDELLIRLGVFSKLVELLEYCDGTDSHNANAADDSDHVIMHLIDALVRFNESPFVKNEEIARLFDKLKDRAKSKACSVILESFGWELALPGLQISSAASAIRNLLETADTALESQKMLPHVMCHWSQAPERTVFAVDDSDPHVQEDLWQLYQYIRTESRKAEFVKVYSTGTIEALIRKRSVAERLERERRLDFH